MRKYLNKKEIQTFLRVGWYQYSLEKITIEFHFLEITRTATLDLKRN